MKLNKEFSVCTIAGNTFLVPTGAAVIDMDKMIDLNELAVFIVELIKEKSLSFAEITDAIMEEYDIDKNTVCSDLSDFVWAGAKLGFIQMEENECKTSL